MMPTLEHTIVYNNAHNFFLIIYIVITNEWSSEADVLNKNVNKIDFVSRLADSLFSCSTVGVALKVPLK